MRTKNKGGVLKRIVEEHYDLKCEKSIFISDIVHSIQSFCGHTLYTEIPKEVRKWSLDLSLSNSELA